MNPNFPPPVLFPLLLACLVSGVPLRVNAQDGAATSAKAEVSGSALESVNAPVKAEAPKAKAGGDTPVPSNLAAFPGKTELDDPAISDARFVVPSKTKGKPPLPKLAKIDLDGDLDYDGTLDNTSSSDLGQLEFVPPGLELGEGEVTRVVVRFKTYETEFPGDLVVTIELEGVNRDATSGLFVGASESSVGRIRVWRDQARKELLLDSADASKQRFEWRFDPEKRAGGIPRTLYVEGVKVSPKFEGDLRLLLSAVQVAEGADPKTPGSLYQSAFDHLLFTVRKEPVEKEFINNNVEGVWSTTSSSAKPAGAPAGEAPKSQ